MKNIPLVVLPGTAAKPSDLEASLYLLRARWLKMFDRAPIHPNFLNQMDR